MVLVRWAGSRIEVLLATCKLRLQFSLRTVMATVTELGTLLTSCPKAIISMGNVMEYWSCKLEMVKWILNYKMLILMELVFISISTCTLAIRSEISRSLEPVNLKVVTRTFSQEGGYRDKETNEEEERSFGGEEKSKMPGIN